MAGSATKWDVWDVLSLFLLKIYATDYKGFIEFQWGDFASIFKKVFKFGTVCKICIPAVVRV